MARPLRHSRPDDLTAGVLEVVTSTGKYYWIGLEQIIRLEFAPPKTVRDLLWRQADLEVKKGPTGVVYIPVLYPGSAQHEDDQRATGPHDRCGKGMTTAGSRPGPANLAGG